MVDVDVRTTESVSHAAHVPVTPVTVEGPVGFSFRRVSWGSILAGFFAAFAIQLLLSLLGLAFGFWSIDPLHENQPLEGLGIGAYVWWLVTGIIALFLGGALAGRMSGFRNQMDGLLQGVVVWGLLTVAGFYLAGSAMGAIVNATTSALSTGLTAAGHGLQAAGSGIAATADAMIPAPQNQVATNQDQTTNQTQSAMRIPAIDYERVGQELNEVLRETGKEKLSPENLTQAGQQMQSVATNAAQEALKNPDTVQHQLERVVNEFYTQIQDLRSAVDKQAVVNVLTANTDIEEDEARRIVDRWQDQYAQASQSVAATQAELEDQVTQATETVSNLGENIQDQAAETYQSAKTNVLRATEETLDAIAHAAFWSFLSLLFGLGAAASGGYVGTRRVGVE